MLDVKKRLNNFKEKITSYHGFCADPTKEAWENKLDYVRQMTVEDYLSRPTNRACHNYCQSLSMPFGTRNLLGLGLKYCVKHARPTFGLKITMERFKSDVRRLHWFIENPPEEDDDNPRKYTPGLYWKSTWDPPAATHKIERCLNRFETELKRRRSLHQKISLSNLTPYQWDLCNFLRKNNLYIVIEADKNLGGCILKLSLYTTRGITEHLSNTSVYRRLLKKRALQLNHILRYKAGIWLDKHQDAIYEGE